ncbi:MAG TPA: nuclear transport factor 2 family protein [Thermoleophilaceae bacterium]|nr:nuclear transport factor 2 family protein [Thermoleophilaceae bacterium]
MSGYLAAAKRGDWETAFGCFAEDIVMHVPGSSVLSGDRHGRDAAIDYIETVRAHFRHGKIELELIDMLSSDERVVLLVRERFHGQGTSVEIRRANVYRVKGDKIVEISIFEADQHAVDALVAEIAERGERGAELRR